MITHSLFIYQKCSLAEWIDSSSSCWSCVPVLLAAHAGATLVHQMHSCHFLHLSLRLHVPACAYFFLQFLSLSPISLPRMFLFCNRLAHNIHFLFRSVDCGTSCASCQCTHENRVSFPTEYFSSFSLFVDLFSSFCLPSAGECNLHSVCVYVCPIYFIVKPIHPECSCLCCGKKK